MERWSFVPEMFSLIGLKRDNKWRISLHGESEDSECEAVFIFTGQLLGTRMHYGEWLGIGGVTSVK